MFPRVHRYKPGAVLVTALVSTLALTACADGPPDALTAPDASLRYARGGSTSATVTVTVTDASRQAVSGVTVGLVGPSGAIGGLRGQTVNGVVTFTSVPSGDYCVWASPVPLSAFNAGGDQIVPPGAVAAYGTGKPDQGAVLTTAKNRQDVVTEATYGAYCATASGRPVKVSGNTSVGLQLASFGTSSITLLSYDDQWTLPASTAFLVAPFNNLTAWRNLQGDYPGIQYGFLLGASTTSEAMRSLPAPVGDYFIELLTMGPDDVPASISLHQTGPFEFGDRFVEPLTCEVGTVNDVAGDASNPDITGAVSYGYGAEANALLASSSRFAAWWEQNQTSPVSMRYRSRTVASGYPTLQLSLDFDVSVVGGVCTISNSSVSGTGAAIIGAKAYCAVVPSYAGSGNRVRVTVVEKNVPAGSEHSFAIGTPGNPGAAESVPDASRYDSNSSFVNSPTPPSGQSCGGSANDPKFDVLN